MQGSSTLTEILSLYLTIVIPYFQRPYIWTKSQIGPLLKDIYRTAEIAVKNEGGTDPERIRHFTGNLTFWPDKNNNLNVIDGQQRLTTIFMIFDNLRKYTAHPLNNNGPRYHIHYTVSKLLSYHLESNSPPDFKFGDSRLKFKPCYRDLAFYRILLNYDRPITDQQYAEIRNMTVEGRSAEHSESLIAAHQQISHYMRRDMGLGASDWDQNPQIMTMVDSFYTALMRHIDFVAHKVSASRDPYTIFQRLNSLETKRPLSDLDLIYSQVFTLVSPKSEAEERALIDTRYMKLHDNLGLHRDEITDLHRHYILASGGPCLNKNKSFSEDFSRHVFADIDSISIPEFIRKTDEIASAIEYWIELRNKHEKSRDHEGKLDRPALFVYRMMEMKLFDKIAPIILLMAIKRHENSKNSVSAISDAKFMEKATATLVAIESWMLRRTLGRILHNSDVALRSDDLYAWHDLFKSEVIDRLIQALRNDFSEDSFKAFLYCNGGSMSDETKCLSNADLLAYSRTPVKFYSNEAVRAKLARVILEAVEDQMRLNTRESKDSRFIQRAAYEVDHISPKAALGDGGLLTEHECYSLGNLTLLSQEGNRKKKHHTDSHALASIGRADLRINKSIWRAHFPVGDFDEIPSEKLNATSLKWGPDSVRDRHEMILNAVMQIWPSLSQGESHAVSVVDFPVAVTTENLAVSNG